MAEDKRLDLAEFVAVKRGMTRVFTEAGDAVSVTVVELIPNFVSQVKNSEKDGYSAYQLAYHQKKESRVSKPILGHLKKSKIEDGFAKFYEVRLKEGDPSDDHLGSPVGHGLFVPGKFVDVTGVTKGKGFQGVVKKFGFRGGPASHGSHFHRSGGSVGNRATPGKIFKNKKMPGHLGDKKCTVQNIQIVKVDAEKNYMLLKGPLPGSNNDFLKISLAVKKA